MFASAAAFVLASFVSVDAVAADAPIKLVMRGDDLPRERLREAIARELGRLNGDQAVLVA